MKRKHKDGVRRGTRGNDTGETSASNAATAKKGNLAETIRRRFAPFGGVELEIPRRDAARPAPRFDEESPEKL
jgi:hypothetical protein